MHSGSGRSAGGGVEDRLPRAEERPGRRQEPILANQQQSPGRREGQPVQEVTCLAGRDTGRTKDRL